MGNDRQATNEPIEPNRRTTLKAMVGVGVAATVWSEPTIKGLVRRPAFAAGASGFPDSADITLIVEVPSSNTPPSITSVSNLNPFGHGPLNFQENFNSNNLRYRIRLDGTQTGGNSGASIGSGTSDPTTEWISNTPNNGGWLRWGNAASGTQFTVVLTVNCV